MSCNVMGGIIMLDGVWLYLRANLCAVDQKICRSYFISWILERYKLGGFQKNVQKDSQDLDLDSHRSYGAEHSIHSF